MNLKESAGDKIKIHSCELKYFYRVENIVEKRVCAHYEQFLLFPQCFPKILTTDT